MKVYFMPDFFPKLNFQHGTELFCVYQRIRKISEMNMRLIRATIAAPQKGVSYCFGEFW